MKLFKIFNCLLIYNNKPFHQFYNEYFKDLGLFKTIDGETCLSYEKNPFLVQFILKNNNKIFVKKRKFFTQKKNQRKGSFLENIINKIEVEEEIYEGLTNTSSNDEEFEFELYELIDINGKKLFKVEYEVEEGYSNEVYYVDQLTDHLAIVIYVLSLDNTDDVVKNFLDLYLLPLYLNS